MKPCAAISEGCRRKPTGGSERYSLILQGYGRGVKRESETQSEPERQRRSFRASARNPSLALRLRYARPDHTFFRNVIRPVLTHSTTKMLPSLSNAASCGWTNLPASHSFGCVRTAGPLFRLPTTLSRQALSSP